MPPVPQLRGPDFFIVGAPKCGTTAMASYLAQHPEIGMCPRKETHYFATDLRSRLAVKRGQRPPSEAEYLSFFDGIQDQRRLGEASVWYLYSAAAANEIHAFCANADIIIMLRNPIEMLSSLHSQFVFVGLEPEEDFDSAWNLDEERERTGTPRGFPPHSYRSAIRYAEQIRRYIEVFGREHLHVILYDDFREDTLGAYGRTCDFLGVDSSFRPTLEVVNANKQVRSRALRNLVRRPPERVRPLLHQVTSQGVRRRAGAAVTQLNRRFVRREPIAVGARESIRPEVARQVRELDELIGLDVSAWLD